MSKIQLNRILLALLLGVGSVTFTACDQNDSATDQLEEAADELEDAADE